MFLESTASPAGGVMIADQAELEILWRQEAALASHTPQIKAYSLALAMSILLLYIYFA